MILLNNFCKLNIYLLLLISALQINTIKAMDSLVSKEESLSEILPKKNFSWCWCKDDELSEEEHILRTNPKEIKEEDNFWNFLIMAKNSSGIYPIQGD